MTFELRPYLAGIKNLVQWKTVATGGSSSAAYCYSIWLRHLCHLVRSGQWNSPQRVAEFGPGDSIGTGLMALLTGSEKYYALDVVPYFQLESSLDILDELTVLLEARAPIPGLDQFPRILPLVENNDFPSDVLTDELLKESLRPQRIERIRESLRNVLKQSVSPSRGHDAAAMISYLCPWQEQGIPDEKVDLIFSHSCLEHVDELSRAYEVMGEFMESGGVMSHSVDFKSHTVSDFWNGHLKYDDLSWKLIRSRRPYLLNRRLLSHHLEEHRKNHFDVVESLLYTAYPKEKYPRGQVSRRDLAKKYRSMDGQDFSTTTALLIALKDK